MSDWTNGAIQVGVFATNGTPEAMTEWLKALLPAAIQDLNDVKVAGVELTPTT